MKILVVFPIEMRCTADLASGLVWGLKQTGHEVFTYETGKNINGKSILLDIYNKYSQTHNGERIVYEPTDFVNEGFFDSVIVNDIELVIVVRGLYPSTDYIDKLKKLGIKTALYITDDPYDYTMMLPITSHYDYVFSNDRIGEKLYKGCKYVPVACDTSVYYPINNALSLYDITFIGTFFKERVEFFDSIYEYLKDKKTFFMGYWIANNSDSPLDSFGSIDESPTLQLLGKNRDKDAIPSTLNLLYNSTTILPNPHRGKNWIGNNVFEATNLNPRVFEIVASGGFQLVSNDREATLREYFDDEIISYSSPSDFKDKCSYFLKNEKERTELVEKAYEKVVSNHTYKQRAKLIMNHITGE